MIENEINIKTYLINNDIPVTKNQGFGWGNDEYWEFEVKKDNE